MAERDDVLRRAAHCGDRHGAAVGDLDAFLHRYYEHVAAEDLVERQPEDLAGLALSHRQLAQRRAQGTSAVRVFTPEADDQGWTVGHTVVEIVTDDVPFLVDSVSAELTRTGHAIHLVIHPQLLVRRDLAGELRDVLDSPVDAGAGAADVVQESWIHVEVDRRSDPAELGEIAAGLRRILEDVRIVNEDWPRMRHEAERLAQELTDAPPAGVDPGDAEEAAALLRWMADGHFTFLGYRTYDLLDRDGADLLGARTGSGLGVLRHDQRRTSGSFGRLTPEARAKARERKLLILTKANSRATVHRPAYLDYIGVKSFDAEGNVTGERRFLGLFASSAYTDSVTRIPVVRRKVATVLRRSGFPADSHSGKDLLGVLETYPRDELFQTDVDDLFGTAVGVTQLQERRRTRLFVRPDEYGRFVSCMVYLPRDRFTASVRREMSEILRSAYDGSGIDFTARVTESVLARMHFVVRMPPGRPLPDVDPGELEHRLVQAARSWEEDLAEALRAELGEAVATRLERTWATGLPESYKEQFSARAAVADLRRLEELYETVATERPPIATALYEPVGAAPGERRFKLFRREPLSLTHVLPYLANLGVEVVDERPYRLGRADGDAAWVYDFGLRASGPGAWAGDGHSARELFSTAFAAAWRGETESDGFDRLVLAAGLTYRQVEVLRAYARYLRQTGIAYSQVYLEECLSAHTEVAVLLVRLFETRFDPDAFADGDTGLDRRMQSAADLAQHVHFALEDVESLDHDRILRSFLGLILATVRTNHWRPGRRSLALKLDPRSAPELPEPRPAHEIFVYSPRVEGVHLRFGAVARGGLRWSDRREDYRTEVLGLVKAQMVKNAVIVPTGAKGGFVAKQLPDQATDRDAWLAEGISCYRTFISGLLDLTDNRRTGPDGSQEIVPPERVVRHDGDDPYLVVAADKGTAAFSDIANEIAAGYGFWLGDAFASGGSAGYDHKAMGITAKGAWESVRRHFRELGRDVQTDETTVAGIGDMSGDVFGNGLLLSRSLRLVAAFDHRHVFLDPDPDPAVSFAERERLFALPRSSWADYDAELISEGGGVYPRSAKAIPVTPQVARRLGLREGVRALTPPEVIRAILTADVDLLWNGGIGTYVKASSESHAEVGDKANDAIRVDGRELRATVVGEGGNLGLTQLGRVEAARSGVRVNTDAIDNSAGVDCSDHEVNIKIVLDRVVADGDLTAKQRNALLAEMTDDVSALVLRDNYEQNVLLGNARRQSRNMLGVHTRLIRTLEAAGQLDRGLEFLPDDAELARRAEAGAGLTSPEFAVLVAYVKLTLSEELAATALVDDPGLDRVLVGYFPSTLGERYADRLRAHPLRARIIVTRLVNDMVNRGGITFAHRAQDETAASAEQVVRAYTACREIFDLDRFVAAVEALDNVVSTDTQARLYLTFRRLLDRSVRWFLQARAGTIDIAAEIARFAPVVAEVGPGLMDLCVGAELASVQRDADELVAAGVPAELARWTAGLLTQFMLLDITEIAASTGVAAAEVARVHLTLADRYAVDALLTRITGLSRADRWQALARGALRYDLYAALQELTVAVLTGTPAGPARARIARWEADNAAVVERALRTLGEIVRLEGVDIAAVSVALRTLRSVVRAVAPVP